MDFSILIFLYLSFRLKHFVCDFLLQTEWMALNKGKPGIEGYKALIPHVAIHSIGSLIIVLAFAPTPWWLSVLDFFIHGFIDRIKGIVSHNKKIKADKTVFWWLFGLDQEMHNLTHMIYIILIFTFLNDISYLDFP